MGKPLIAVDCDGILSDFTGYCLRVVNERLGTHYTEADVRAWFARDWGGPAVEKVVDEVLSSPRWVAECSPYPGAWEHFDRLLRRFRVAVVTSVPEHAREARRDWLERHRMVPHELHFARTAEKAGYVARMGAVALVEDNRDTCLALASISTTLPILVDRPWNQGLTPGVVRVASLGQVAEQIPTPAHYLYDVRFMHD